MSNNAVNQNAPEDQSERKRVQLELSQQAYERLARLRERADVKTNAEAIRNALRLYEWFLEQKERGYEVGINLVKDGKTKEVELVI